MNNSSSSIDSLDAAVKEIAKHELSFFDLSTLIEKFSHALSAPVLKQLIDALMLVFLTQYYQLLILLA